MRFACSTLLFLLVGCGPIKPPNPTPTPTPTPTPPPVECLPGIPWCDPAAGLTCGNCKHNPTSDPSHCEMAPACPGPGPTPPPGGSCVLSGEPDTASSMPNTLGGHVNDVMHELRPDCDVGGTCLLGNTTQQEWQRQVEEKLRARGLCAGQHAAGTDEIAVAGKATDPWQGFHIFVGDDSLGPVPPGGVRRTVKWSPQAFSGAWLPPGGSAPPPTSGPCPPPQPVKAYPDGRPHWKYNWKPHTMGNADTTPVVVAELAFCEAIGLGTIGDPPSPRASCPVRPDGHPERTACEDYLREGPATRVGRNGQDCTPNNTENPAAILYGTGNCRMCNPDRSVCTDWF